uniref:Frizzled-7-like n=1 Tax=Gouania willdenowi TaxID=441366 RepID=A0A8C5DIW3_GOUWI
PSVSALRTVGTAAFALMLLLPLATTQSKDRVTDHGRCQPISIPLCLDVAYNMTMLPTLLGHSSQEEAGLEVQQFFPLVKVRCSEELRFFLCSLYAPVCTILDRPVPPCRSLCQRARRGCVALMNRFGFPWPERLRCEKFPVLGAGEICISPPPVLQTPGTQIHQTFSCPGHLQVPSYLNYRLLGVQHCGAPCEPDRPDGLMYFSQEELTFSRLWLGSWSFLCFLSSFFTVLTFLLDQSRFQYPDKPIAFMSGCYSLVAAVYGTGFLLGDSVVCVDKFKEDGYRMVVQGTGSEACTALSVVLYFFSMAGSMWWVVLSLAWFLSARLKWAHEAVEAQSHCFHLLAWAVPALQTSSALASGRVEGDMMTGFCHVGVNDVDALQAYVLLPLLSCMLISTVLLTACLASLLRIRTIMKSAGSSTSTLEKLMVKLCVLGVLRSLPAGLVAACCLYERVLRWKWEQSWFLQTCRRLASSCPTENFTPATPDFKVLLLKHTMVLTEGAVLVFWACSEKTLQSWNCICKRLRTGNTSHTTTC